MKRIITTTIALGAFFMTEAQNVGIGTNTPTEKLHVQGGARVTSLSGVGNRLVQSNATGVLSNVANGPVGTFLGINGAGTYAWMAPPVATADNGLYFNVGANSIRMGGPLVENTTVTVGAYQMVWELNSTGDFTINDAGVPHFQLADNGISYFGDNTQWRDNNAVTGTLFAQIYDDGDDGHMILYENGLTQINLDANGTSIFNELGFDRDFRIETNNQANLFFVNGGQDVASFSGVNAAPYVLGNATPVHTMYYPFEIGSDGNGGLQATIGYFRAQDVEVNPESGGFGYVGYDVAGAGDEWWRMYSNGYIVSSRREIKHDIHAVNDNPAMEDYIVSTIKNMRPSVYNYYNEYDEMIPGKENHYRPAYRMGLIVDETPDFILDEGFSGVDIYGLASLSLAGVQHNMKEIEAIKTTKTIQDFGSVSVNSAVMEIAFAEDFEGEIPVITVTSNNANVTVSVVEKTSIGFKVQTSGVANGLQLDWIAMAKKRVQSIESKEMPTEMKNKFEVPSETKKKIEDFYKDFKSTIGPGTK